jgi:hypothetical protein
MNAVAARRSCALIRAIAVSFVPLARLDARQFKRNQLAADEAACPGNPSSGSAIFHMNG